MAVLLPVVLLSIGGVQPHGGLQAVNQAIDVRVLEDAGVATGDVPYAHAAGGQFVPAPRLFGKNPVAAQAEKVEGTAVGLGLVA